MKNPSPSPGSIPAAVRSRLDQARNALLHVHKALLDEEKLAYERTHGPIPTAGAYLQLVIHDPWFAWLHPMTELVVQIDELVASKEPVPAGAGEALADKAKRLLTPSDAGDPFQKRYFDAIHRSPSIAVAHAAGIRILIARSR